MRIFLLGLLPALVAAAPLLDSVTVQVEPRLVSINGTLEYSTACKKCPYNICTNVSIPSGGDNVTLTCWTNGDTIDDTKLWLKTTDDCYLSEYDLYEYSVSADLAYCGRVPLEITRQPATVRYLSVCKWGRGTSSESMEFYGRDQDVTLTCWSEGGDIMGNTFWYKTTDNCHVSGSGLWGTPDRSRLDDCGPGPGGRLNGTRRSIDQDETRATKLAARDDGKSSTRRWLQPEQIGEEYAPCYSCPTATLNDTCKVVTVYEYNQTVVSQCYTNEFVQTNETIIDIKDWMLTTDWCYVNGNDFWVPPWDNYRYPNCDKWPGYGSSLG